MPDFFFGLLLIGIPIIAFCMWLGWGERKSSAPPPPDFLYQISWRTWRATEWHNAYDRQAHKTYFRALPNGEYEFLINSPSNNKRVVMPEGARIEVMPHVFDCGDWVFRNNQHQRVDKVINGGALVVHQPNGSINVVALYQEANGVIAAQNHAAAMREIVENRAAQKVAPSSPAASGVADAPRAAGFDL